MGQIDIFEKLGNFLRKHSNFKEECEIVYLLVELRKILDHNKNEFKSTNYPLVRFHADWIVHTRKDYITPSIKDIMKKVDNSIIIFPKDGNIDFLMLPEFKKELKEILETYNLPNGFCQNDADWMNFMLLLTQVIADQPLINPTENIAEFRYVDMKGKGIMANIIFRGSKSGGSITIGFGK